MLRIGIYTSSLPQSHAKPPGVDVFVDRLGERLARRGHHVEMLTYSPPGEPRSYHLRELRPGSTATSRLQRLAVAPLRLNALDTSPLDVLHLHGDDWFYVRRAVPTVRTLHGSAFYEARHATSARRRTVQYLTYGLERLSARLATRSYGVNPDPGPGSGRAGHLPLAVDLPADWRAERAGPPLVLFVGTWDGRKRGRLLHEAFVREVRPRHPDARLVMVSDRCEPGPGVEWVARPTDDELTRLYRAAWVFCMPSSYEGFGLPYLEAMAQGTPVLAADNPGARFVLGSGRHGLIADDARLGSELAALIADAPRRAELAHAGRRRAAEFSWDALLDQHERAYREAIAAFTAPRATRRPLAIASGISKELAMARRHCRPRSFLRYGGDVFAYRWMQVRRPRRYNQPRTIRLRNGVEVTYRLTRADIQTVREVCFHEAYRLPFELPGHGGTLLDLGGNIGLAAVYLARRHRFERVVIVEPVAENAALARLNCARNGVRAEVIQAAVAPAPGEVSFVLTSEHNQGHIDGAAGGGIRVPATTVADLAGPGGGVRLVKLDIEGGEGPLLTDRAEWLDGVTALVGEFHPDVVDYPGLVELLKRRGFTYFEGGSVLPFSADAFLQSDAVAPR